MRIGNQKISNQTLIIAEAGINHNGNMEMAKKLIEKAKEAGADAVKFQIFKANEFCSEKSKYFNIFKSIEFSKIIWRRLINFATKVGIIFFASVLGEKSADILDEIGAPWYKIASGDITHLPFLEYVAKKGKPIFLSTGASTIGEIEEALKIIYKTGNRQVALLHCVANYPSKYKETNLRVIQALKKTFNLAVGFSDHTIGIITPVIAVASGAEIIEKHFTLDKNLSGGDHKISLEPKEFKAMVKKIRMVEKMLGDGIKRPTKDERKIKQALRRSLTASVNIPKRVKIKKKMIKIVRPGRGIQPKFINAVLKMVAKTNIRKDEVITWGKIKQ